MKKGLYLIALVITALVTGGCGTNINIPDTEAFQDEFTRGFMNSSEEVEEGYYLFESGTDGFTMLFPKNATMDRVYYQKPSPVYERVSFGEQRDDNATYYITLKFENRSITEDMERNLRYLSRALSYEGDYLKFNHEHTTYYYAKKETHILVDERERTHYSFFGYISSNNTFHGIEYMYHVFCTAPENSCKIDLEKEEAHAKKLMKSVQFQEH